MHKDQDMDDLDLSIAQRTAVDPEYPRLLDIEVRRQRIIGRLVAARKANDLTQAAIAAQMKVSQSVVAEIEAGRADIRFSTLERYAEAATRRALRLDLVDA
jgi:ribosome-binding protein aMBF1 (putative translation factor)